MTTNKATELPTFPSCENCEVFYLRDQMDCLTDALLCETARTCGECPKDKWRGAMTHHLNDLFDQLFAELEDQKYDKSYGHQLLVIDFADVIKPLLRLKQAVLGALEP